MPKKSLKGDIKRLYLMFYLDNHQPFLIPTSKKKIDQVETSSFSFFVGVGLKFRFSEQILFSSFLTSV